MLYFKDVAISMRIITGFAVVRHQIIISTENEPITLTNTVVSNKKSKEIVNWQCFGIHNTQCGNTLSVK